MKLVFDARAWEDYQHWQATDAKLLGRLNGLIREGTPRSPAPASPSPCAARSPAGGRAG